MEEEERSRVSMVAEMEEIRGFGRSRVRMVRQEERICGDNWRRGGVRQA